jgi:hypothetical protein
MKRLKALTELVFLLFPIRLELKIQGARRQIFPGIDNSIGSQSVIFDYNGPRLCRERRENLRDLRVSKVPGHASMPRGVASKVRGLGCFVLEAGINGSYLKVL